MIPSTYALPPAPDPTPKPMLGPSPYAELDRPLFTPGHVTIPKSDADVQALVRQSKAVLDHQDRAHVGQHPAQTMAYQKARGAHIEAVVRAVQQYHEEHPTPFSQQVLDAIHSDPNLQVAHLRSAKKKP